jgi:methionyl-tRNA formyltransferase
VLTRPDQAAGRGLNVTASPVKRLALAKGCPVFQPVSLKPSEAAVALQRAHPDVFIVAAYGLLVPAPILALPVHGAVNVHASLLPRWRGASPIQRALLAGDQQTGISIMKMDEGLDTGPVYQQRRLAIAPDDDAGSLHDKLAALGGEALLDVLESIEGGRARALAQPTEGVTYAPKIDKRETQLDWRRPAVELERLVRAFSPVPGASARLGDESLKIRRAEVIDVRGDAGTVLAGAPITVACGEGALRILELQRAGGRRIGVAEFVRGRPIPAGTRFQ